MSRFLRKSHLSFQSRVLLPVVTVLVLLVVITMWIVNHRITEQLQTEAADKLATADAVFKNSLKIRAKNLLLQYHHLPNEPRFKAVSMLADPKTLRFLLVELMEEQGGDIVLYTSESGERLISVARDARLDTGEFSTRTSLSVQQALDGQPNVDTVRLDSRLLEAVSIPVKVGNNVVGALTFGTEIGESVAQEFKQLTHSEIAFFADDRLAASTLLKAELNRQLAVEFHAQQPSALSNGGGNAEPARKALLGEEHFLTLTGQFNSQSGDGKLGYVLLSSYEQPLSALLATQRMLAVVSLSGILLSTLIVCGLIRKITQPLRQLRDSAEAVGRGDFSQRVAVTSHDECGELAVVFNRMTENLNISRAELEKTVQTLKNTQAQLIQSEKLSAIGEFVAGVTHELNNPLTSVIGFAELLQQSDVEEKHRNYLNWIVTSAQRCHKIVQSLLSFARQHKPERKLVRLHELVEAAVNILQYHMRTSNIQVTTHFDPQLPEVMADPHQMQQVFLNIINNGRQAIEGFRPKGAMQISTESSEGRVRVIVQDDGPGISAENLGKLFNPFFTTKEVGKGTGLGLSLSYGIVKEHGGTINVRSQFGQGATFVIELPAAASSSETPEAAERNDHTTSNACDGKGRRVLVVDDEDSILDLIREALSVNGYQMDIARDGESALRNLRRKQYDLTVCDWRMPGLNGQQVYERLRALDPAAAGKFIFITGDVVNEQAQSFIKERGNICLAKPFSLDEFRSAVGTALKAP